MQLNIRVPTVVLPVQISMARAVVTFKLMPESPEVDLTAIKKQAALIVKESGAIGETQTKEEPIAFGLKAVLVLGMYDVEKCDFEAIAAKLGNIKEVQSSEVAKMDLALG